MRDRVKQMKGETERERERKLPNRQRFEFIVRTYYALKYRFCLLLKELKERVDPFSR